MSANRDCQRLQKKIEKERESAALRANALALVQARSDPLRVQAILDQERHAGRPTHPSASLATGNTGPRVPTSIEDLQRAALIDTLHLPGNSPRNDSDDHEQLAGPACDDDDAYEEQKANSLSSKLDGSIHPWNVIPNTASLPPTNVVVPIRGPSRTYESTKDFVKFRNTRRLRQDTRPASDDSVSSLDDDSLTPLNDNDDSAKKPAAASRVTNIPLLVMPSQADRTDDVVDNETFNVRRDYPDQWRYWQQPQAASRKDVCLLRLVNLLEKRGCPHIMFEEILEWVEDLIDKGVLRHGKDPDFLRKTKRKTYMKRLMEIYPTPPFTWQIVAMETKQTQAIMHAKVWFKGEDSLAGYYEHLNQFQRTNRDCSWVPKTDFAHQLINLLSDRTLFGNLDNLQLNRSNMPDSLYRPYENATDDKLDDIMSGSWYRDTVRRMNLGTNDYLMPILLYMDKTGTDAYQRYGLEPVLFTIASLRRHVRNLSSSWRSLGFIPDLELRSKAEKNRDRSSKMKGTSNRNYQQILRVVLESLSAYQHTGIKHNLNLGPYRREVTIWPKVCFVMGDAKSGDCLTGRYGTHDKLVRRQSRHCFTTFNHLDVPHHPCSMIRTYQMRFLNILSYANTGLVTSILSTTHSRHEVSLGGVARRKRRRRHDSDSSNQSSESSREIEVMDDSDTSELSDVVLLRKRMACTQRGHIAQQTEYPLYSAIQGNVNEEDHESSDFPNAVYKTAVMAGDIILKNELLLNHRHVLVTNRQQT